MGYSKQQQAFYFQRDKSLLVTYFCWLVGGLFGLHHFYLRRDKHAFLWWSTLGGYGVGWMSDIYKIPRYVREANEDPRFIEEYVAKLRRYKTPQFSVNRFTGAVVVAYSWGQMFLSAIPQDEIADINWKFLYWFAPIPVALGVWTVGNVGRQRGSIWAALLAAACAAPTRYWVLDEGFWMIIMVICSALAFDSFSKRWRRDPPKKQPMLRRLTVLGFCACLYLSLWIGFLYFNGTVTDSEGDEIPVHEAIHHFFSSPWWNDLQQSLYETYQYAQHNGWYEIWKQIIDLSDPRGEQNAYKVLGVSIDASQQEITATWRKLSREFHPDKVRDEKQRAHMQEKFLEIQEAYQILSNTRSRRNRKNKKDNADAPK